MKCLLRILFLIILFQSGYSNHAYSSRPERLPSIFELDASIRNAQGNAPCAQLFPNPVESQVNLCLNFFNGDFSVNPKALSTSLSTIPRNLATPQSDISHGILNLVFMTQDLDDVTIIERLSAAFVTGAPFTELRNLGFALLFKKGTPIQTYRLYDYKVSIRPYLSINLRTFTDPLFIPSYKPGKEFTGKFPYKISKATKARSKRMKKPKGSLQPIPEHSASAVDINQTKRESQFVWRNVVPYARQDKKHSPARRHNPADATTGEES